MAFKYNWKNKEASFGPPINTGIPGGTHITFEIILKLNNKFIALRRPKGIPEHELPHKAEKYPKGLLYFCHNLIRYGESIEECVKRIVKYQAGVKVKKFRVVYLESGVHEKDNEWAFIPHIIAEIDNLPKINELIIEVVQFDKNSIPNDFAWWSKEDLKWFIDSFD